LPRYSETGDSTRPCSGLRTAKSNAKDATALLDTPTRTRGTSPAYPGDDFPRRTPGSPQLRRDLAEDFTTGRARRTPFDDDEPAPRRAKSGFKFRLRSRIPRSVAGRIATGAAFLVIFGGVFFTLYEAHAALLHDPRLIIPSSRNVEITGNNHLTRAQLLSVFGGDVDRNILNVPLDLRRDQLESLPWVEHATVMRLLPNHIRVAITERTPVAFVRQNSEIGLVDAHGVLLDLSPDSPSDKNYSFPVVTGISSTDPLDTRAARMKLFLRFTSELDADAKTPADKVSNKLSEVDLTDPEDVKALIPDNGADVLVHFGDENFLPRYERYLHNLPGWKTRFPKLASVDMRYEHEVVLEMQPGATVPIPGDTADSSPAPTTPAHTAITPKKSAAAKPVLKAKPKAKPKTAVKPKAKPATYPHLEVAFPVHPKAASRR
jgi:cell division protein FtsQ